MVENSRFQDEGDHQQVQSKLTKVWQEDGGCEEGYGKKMKLEEYPVHLEHAEGHDEELSCLLL